MPTVTLSWATELVSDAPQVRLTRVSPAQSWDLTIPAGLYYLASVGNVGSSIVTALNVQIASKIGGAAAVSVGADGLHLEWSGGSAYTLRLLDCTDAPYLATMLGLYGPGRNLLYYQAVDAPAVWSPSLAVWTSSCGYDHAARDQYGIPEWIGDTRVAETGAAARLTRARRNVLDLTLSAIPGAALSAYTGGSVTFWDAYNPEYREPYVYVVITNNGSTRIAGEYSLIEPISPESVQRSVDGWTGLYSVSMRLVRM